MDALSETALGFIAAGLSRIDDDRLRRTGVPEVVFAERKTVEQIESAMRALYDSQGFALATRISADAAASLRDRLPEARHDATARALRCGSLPATGQTIGVICAGTSDVPVAEEAAFVLEAFGHSVVRRYDVGVAGLHRLLADFEGLSVCRALIVVAGMEGALPSVLAGLTRTPVIGVPTSVGYGAAFEGMTALLAMLSSCAPGIAVVGIDNGFGAAAFAHKLVLEAPKR